MNSKGKGKRGELELAEVLRDAGFDARRGAQFSGANGDPDVVSSIPGLHIEVKRTERLQLWPAIQQAIRDCRGKLPTVWHRANRQPWLITMRAKDFIELMKKSQASELPESFPRPSPGPEEKQASRQHGQA